MADVQPDVELAVAAAPSSEVEIEGADAPAGAITPSGLLSRLAQPRASVTAAGIIEGAALPKKRVTKAGQDEVISSRRSSNASFLSNQTQAVRDSLWKNESQQRIGTQLLQIGDSDLGNLGRIPNGGQRPAEKRSFLDATGSQMASVAEDGPSQGTDESKGDPLGSSEEDAAGYVDGWNCFLANSLCACVSWVSLGPRRSSRSPLTTP